MSRKRKNKKNEEVVEEMTEEILEVEEPVEEVVEEPVEENLEEVVEEPVEENLEEVVEEPVRTLKVTVEKLNVREEPNSDSSVLVVVNKNDVFKIIDETPLYFGIQVNDDVVGYCKKDFVKECE